MGPPGGPVFGPQSAPRLLVVSWPLAENLLLVCLSFAGCSDELWVYVALLGDGHSQLKKSIRILTCLGRQSKQLRPFSCLVGRGCLFYFRASGLLFARAPVSTKPRSCRGCPKKAPRRPNEAPKKVQRIPEETTTKAQRSQMPYRPGLISPRPGLISLRLHGVARHEMGRVTRHEDRHATPLGEGCTKSMKSI